MKRTLALLLMAGALGACALYWALMNRQAGEGRKAPPASSLGQSVSSPPSNLPEPEMSPQAAVPGGGSHQAKVLDEIFASRNDNDPRLDTELRHLSPEVKRELEAKYARLPGEKRNERGTIAFLIGRDLATEEDARFLKSVLEEPPCLSLADCHSAGNAPSDPHSDLGQDLTLAYPQVVAIQMLHEHTPKPDGGQVSPLTQAAFDALKAGTQSKVPMVAKKASEALTDLQGRGN